MSSKNDKSATLIVTFATIFIMFVFFKQCEDKPTYMIVEIKYVSKVDNNYIYILEAKRDNIWYTLEVDKVSYNNVKIGTPYNAKWKPE